MKPIIPNIGLPADLKPQVRYFVGTDEPHINADGIIKLMDSIETPQARAIRKAFRKRLAKIQISEPDLEPRKQRSQAVLAALADVGIKVNLTPIGAA